MPTSRELTSDELAELTERLKAGNRWALKDAIAALKPSKPARVAKPKAPPDPLARLRRKLTELSTLHAKMMEAKRYWSGLDRQQRCQDEKARELDMASIKEGWDSRLHTLLEPFLQSLRLHFNPPDTK